ncbi:MAG: hypothetical protein CVV42_19100 [Candidatus Riflebacteria bacterium HGW-Riflebacteria-2]|jgi:hypothetical protein|nr:MAG: hypothetical protein CVV42_19100 [Candidatus Riflebacteria bacterium HGW-Riflebacteria-2]
MIALLISLPHILIIFCASSLHLFALPVIDEMMGKLPANALQAYSSNLVVRIAGVLSDAFDFCFNWWFVLIPVVGGGLQVLFLVIKRHNDQAAQAVLASVIAALSVTLFVSLSAQLLTICMLIPNFLK